MKQSLSQGVVDFPLLIYTSIMAKDPAFLFYSSDFLNGIADLTMEERGQYITLLCLQHQKGELKQKTIRLCVGSVSVDVLDKFTKLKNGNYINERLQEEIEKRKNFTNSRRENGKKGGRPPKASGLAKDNLMENENENVIIDSIINNKPFFEILINSESWLETVSMKHKCKVSYIKSKLEEFNNELFLRGDQKSNKKDYQSHFVSWLNLKPEIKQKYTAHQNNAF